MNFKKRVNGSWTDTSHYIHNTSTDIITTLPAVIYPTGTTATVGLKGQTTQSSIPSPTSPVMPQGTGERTGNLAPPLTEWVDGYINSGTGTIHEPTDTQEKTSPFIKVDANTDYSFTHELGDFPAGTNGAWRVVGLYDDTQGFISRIGGADANALTFTTTATTGYIRVSYRTYGDTAYNAMLNLGSTPLSYEKYGYKIPISSASTTTNIYLGEVQTTRRIKKTEVEIERVVTLSNGNKGGVTKPFSEGSAKPGLGLCDKALYGGSSIVGGFYVNRDNAVFIGPPTDTLDDLKSKYDGASIWYVRATEETGIVNEPLMKIGDYADTVSGISIPTIAGANTLSVDTTLQPSEVTVNYKGWHPIQNVHEAENGQWD